MLVSGTKSVKPGIRQSVIRPSHVVSYTTHYVRNVQDDCKDIQNFLNFKTKELFSSIALFIFVKYQFQSQSNRSYEVVPEVDFFYFLDISKRNDSGVYFNRSLWMTTVELCSIPIQCIFPCKNVNSTKFENYRLPLIYKLSPKSRFTPN